MARNYTLTVGGVLAKARRMLNDTRDDMGYRAEDAELIGALSEALRAMVPIVPGLFAQVVTHACTAGARQTIEAERSVALLDIPGLTEGDMATLNAFAPGWTAVAAGAAREFMRLPGEPLSFMVYPPAQAAAQLQPRVVITPQELASDDLDALLPVPEVFEPMLVEYVVGRAEVKDDEHSESSRAAQLLDRFAAGVKSLAT
ncbi:MAG: hypothetical protein HY855_10980 [Burkholderiales bacterium]|nr:hypothetical protein [Burkholderiales bacterium]